MDSRSKPSGVTRPIPVTTTCGQDVELNGNRWGMDIATETNQVRRLVRQTA